MIRWRGFLLGAVTFLSTHGALAVGWSRWFDPSGVHRVWFLNSGRAVACTTITLSTVSAVVAATGTRTPRDRMAEGIAFATGAIAAMAAVLFAGEAGTIFPVVLAVGAIIALAAGVGGALAGGALRAGVSGR